MFKKKNISQMLLGMFSLMYTHLITPYCHNVALSDLFFFIQHFLERAMLLQLMNTHIHTLTFQLGFLFFFISKTDALKLQAVI